MQSLLIEDIARERLRDLQRSYGPRIETSTRTTFVRRLIRQLHWSYEPTTVAGQITIRVCSEHESWAIERLAALQERPRPSGPLLVAKVGGQIEAALPMDGGDPFANPLRRTADLVSLLEVRAEQLRAA